jgi:thioester reductase-like protein
MVLLLRGADDAEVAGRRAELLAYLRACGRAEGADRLVAARGDVTLPRLGLEAAHYRGLCARVTHIVHAAANIGLGQSLSEARRVNVGGAARVLELAGRCPRLEHLAHVSTAYVAGCRDGRILEQELEAGQAFRNAYEQSKCEVEVMMRARMARLPISVFRPAILVGDSRDGHTCNFANIYLPLKLVARGLLRDIPGDGETRLDVVPVDYAADVIAALTCRPRRSGATYHVTAGWERAVRVRDLLEAVIRRLDRGGRRPLRFVESDRAASGSAPRGAAPASPRDGACRGSVGAGARAARRAESLSTFFAYLSGRPDFDDSTMRADLGAALPRFPEPSEYLPNLLAFCEATDWGKELPWKPQPCRPAA